MCELQDARGAAEDHVIYQEFQRAMATEGWERKREGGKEERGTGVGQKREGPEHLRMGQQMNDVSDRCNKGKKIMTNVINSG